MKGIRYGVIGIKGVGQYHLEFARRNPHADVVALVDIDADYVGQQAQAIGARAFTRYQDLLEADCVDAVAIATPHHLHSEIGLTCLKAGVHILVEKPLASRVSEADAMLTVAKAKNLKVAVAHQYRLYRLSQVLKQVIESGEIGQIQQFLWTWGEFRSDAYYARDVWRAEWQYAGGGVLMNQASHDVDLLAWLMGPPAEVSALVANQMHDTPLEDIACATMQFANGALGCFQTSINQTRGHSLRQFRGDQGEILIQNVQSLVADEAETVLIGTHQTSLQDLRTGTNFGGLQDPPGCRHPPYQGGGRGDPHAIGSASDLGCVSPTLKTSVRNLKNHHAQPDIAWRTIQLIDERSRWQRAIRKVKHLAFKQSMYIKRLAQKDLVDNFVRAIRQDQDPFVNGESALTTLEILNAIILSACRKKTVTLPLDREEYDHLFQQLVDSRCQVPRFR